VTNRKNNKKSALYTIVIPIVLFLLLAYNLYKEMNSESVEVSSGQLDGVKMSVHYIDVGQGDSIFIELPDGKCMLIDSGEAQYAETVTNFIKGKGYSKLDYVVATHPHSDHMGSMAKVLKEFDVGQIWMSNGVNNTSSYENLLKVISDKGLKIKTASAGKSIISSENLNAIILAPVSAEYENLNNYSVVVKITYGETKFLFTGDAEALSEKEILSSGADVSADVLKVGHHGSSTSNSDEFIKAVSPSIGIISCGLDNSYGHPHTETVAVLKKYKVTSYQTDVSGTITVGSNGSSLSVSTEK